MDFFLQLKYKKISQYSLHYYLCHLRLLFGHRPDISVRRDFKRELYD